MKLKQRLILYVFPLLISNAINLNAQVIEHIATPQDGKLDSLIQVFNSNYKNLYQITFKDTVIRKKQTEVIKNHKTYLNNVGNELMTTLLQVEDLNYFSQDISPMTRALITSINEPYVLILLEKAIDEYNFRDKNQNIFFTSKILKEISSHLFLIQKHNLPFYSYSSSKKQLLKFISMKMGNDLFAFTRENEDRDYTGSLLVELGTDYLNPKRRRPLKSYQTFLFGFDVYTPQFKDTTKFKNFNDFDTLDRPHGSFQYIGWSKKGLSKYDNLRWSTTVKLGKIGGNIGNLFQTALHQDVSYSLRPKGWDAQISNGGRLGVSVETKHQLLLTLKEQNNLNSLKNFYVAPFTEFKVGTYMTNAALGFDFTNKNFKTNNENQINHRVNQTVNYFWDHFMYGLSFKSTFVVHNTMLEGYGIFSTTDQDPQTIDAFTPRSIYVLEKNQVERIVHNLKVALSYTTRYSTFFYNWYAFSPETKLGKLKTDNPNSSDVDLTNRWHHFGEVGISFNLK